MNFFESLQFRHDNTRIVSQSQLSNRQTPQAAVSQRRGTIKFIRLRLFNEPISHFSIGFGSRVHETRRETLLLFFFFNITLYGGSGASVVGALLCTWPPCSAGISVRALLRH